ncbi:MAG TPA: RusA family crossover junction endodeoxyribonuclease [Terriglobia bacterium]|nr:RusA family crossover junction endodeoxyribonuclease [Terriglobia bacterium]
MPNPPFVLELLGPPRGKGRPRFRIVGKGKKRFVQTYTDAETRKYEDRLRQEASLKMMGIPPSDVPLEVRIEAYMPVPDSWPSRKKLDAIAGKIVPATKPDSDNVVKAILDSFNRVVWKDDAQIVNFYITKRYSERPRLRIVVWEWSE